MTLPVSRIEAVRASWRVALPASRAELLREVLAGVVTSLALIPEVISFALISGVEPRAALFASVVLLLVTSLLGGRPAMVTAAAGSVALVVGPMVQAHGTGYIFPAVLLGGLIQVAFGVLGLARIVRFIPRSVMLGFVNALGILIFCAQVPHVIDKPAAVYVLFAVTIVIVLLGPRVTRDTREAERHGVALVHQEITINPSLTVAENIFIDRLSRFSRYGFMQRRALERAAQQVLDSFDAGIQVSTGIERLDLGQWKCIEIARALSHDPQILFLDEATAFLGHREVDALLKAIRALKTRGLSVAFVSHHLSEVTEVADRLTILKDGNLAGSAHVADIAPAEIHARMVGRDISGHVFPPKAQRPPAEIVLAVQDVSVAGRLDDVRLDVHSGEIVGIAGLKGGGGEAVLELAMGVLAPQRGTLALGANRYAPRHPDAAWRAGVAYLPGDRTGEGLIADFSVLDNIVMARPPRRLGVFDTRQAHRDVSELGARLKIKAAHPGIACRALSGGNLQKVVLAKCLHVAPRLLLLNNPTRGVDIGARIEIYRVIRTLADEGVAVLLVSDDLPELIGLSDRLAVMRGGRIEHTFAAGDTADETTIVRFMT